MNKITSLRKLDNNSPFSKRLNNFVTKWFEANKHLFCEYETNQFYLTDSKNTFDRFLEHFKAHKTIPMWYDANEDNIFGNTIVNAKFRAWHDYMHISQGHNFDLQGEIKVFLYQKDFLPDNWKFEIKLLESEIVGQARHYTNIGTPIKSQREFTIQYIIDNPII